MSRKALTTIFCISISMLMLSLNAEIVLDAVYNGEIKDQSQFHHKASILPAKYQLEYVEAGKGKALKFNGEILYYRQNKNFQPGKENFVMEAKVRVDEKPQKWMTIMAGTPGNGRAYGVRIDKRGKIYAYFEAAETKRGNSTSIDISEKLFDEKFHVITAVRDMTRNGEIRIYLDGVEVTEVTGYQPWPIASGKRYMGFVVGAQAPWYYKKNFFVGAVESIRVYNSIPDQYKAKADAPEPRPIPEVKKDPIAKLSPSDPKSQTEITLVPENTFIVRSSHIPQPQDYQTANMIRQYLCKIYGVTKGFYPIRSDKLPSPLKENQVVIAIGDSEFLLPEDLEKVDSHGFIIKRKGNVIVICGKTPEATILGGSEFLNKFCDVQFYMPTELFTHVPKDKKVTFKGIDIVSNPYIKRSSSSGYHNLKAEKNWLDRNGLERRDGTHQHSFFHLLHPNKYAKKYPKIYPIINGKRVLPINQHSRWQPCFSEPTLVDASEEAAKLYFKDKPDSTYIAFSVMDNHDFCQCDRCKKLLAEHGKVETKTRGRRTWTENPVGHSWIFWDYMNKIAKRLEKQFPDKRIVGISYSQVRVPPPFKLHDNIVVYQVWKHSDNTIDKRFVVDAPEGQEPPNTTRMKQWGKVASHAGHHDWAHGKGFLIPRFYPNMVKDSFDSMEKLGFPFEYTHMEAYPSWGMYGPFYYIVGRIWWDPKSVDVNKMLKKFCDDMFGKSNELMFEFFQNQEKLWHAMNNKFERKLNRYYNQFITTPEEMTLLNKSSELLGKAMATAQDENVKKRINLFLKTFKFSKMIMDAVAKGKADQAASDAILAYAEKEIIPDPMTIYRFGYHPKQKETYIRDIIIKALRMAKVTPRNTYQKKKAVAKVAKKAKKNQKPKEKKGQKGKVAEPYDGTE